MSPLRVVNPATLEMVREVPEDDQDAIAAKSRAARAAQPAWASRPLEARLSVVWKFRELLRRRADDLASLLTAEMGKPIRQSRNELAALQGRITWFLDHTAGALADDPVYAQGPGADGAALTEELRYEPLGVVANISAWNYPYFVGSNVFVPALLAGNTVLYKPSEFATLTGLAIADLLHEAGVPRDGFVPIVGGGAAGAALLAQQVDGVFFTGSYATGRRIAEACGSRMIRLQLELGGKDPAYVCDDVDVAAAAAALADGAFYNAGQSCCAVERVYVHERIAAAFIAAFLETVRGFVVGDPAAEATDIGPVAREAQLAVLADQVADARRQGGAVLLGGERLPRTGYFFAPTVVADANERMTLMREGSFGPIIGIQTVTDDDAAVALMNDTDYGLTAAVYAQDRARAERMLARVDAGTVYWNCCDRVSPRLPWSGRKRSGIGSTLGIAGIRAFVQPKAWQLRAPSRNRSEG